MRRPAHAAFSAAEVPLPAPQGRAVDLEPKAYGAAALGAVVWDFLRVSHSVSLPGPSIDGMAIQKLAYSFEEAAEQSGYSVRTLKQAVADGSLTARYVEAEGVIRHEDLAAWIGQLPTRPNTGTSAVDGGPKPTTPQQAKAPQPLMPEPESEWLTPEDLGKSLQLSPGTLSNWRSQRRGPEFVRMGGMVRYRREAVDAWLKAQPRKV